MQFLAASRMIYIKFKSFWRQAAHQHYRGAAAYPFRTQLGRFPMCSPSRKRSTKEDEPMR
jgi:hypothetical protein